MEIRVGMYVCTGHQLKEKLAEEEKNGKQGPTVSKRCFFPGQCSVPSYKQQDLSSHPQNRGRAALAEADEQGLNLDSWDLRAKRKGGLAAWVL